MRRGLALSQPLPIRNMPGYKNFWYLEYPAKWWMGIRVEKPVFAPGNEYYGVFGSPYLETVFEGPETSSRTPQPPGRTPQPPRPTRGTSRCSCCPAGPPDCPS